jgi:ABC-type nitrate/sulfonate/bicarbonate transport system permease component
MLGASQRVRIERASGFALVGLLLGAWEWASSVGWLQPFYFPSLGRIGASLAAATLSGELARAMLASLGRGFAGYGLAALAGVSLGLLAGRHSAIYRLIEPLVESLRPLPATALLPIAILLLGIGTAMKVAVVAWACFFPIMLNTLDGVRGVSPALIDTAHNLGLGNSGTLLRVILPAASPSIMTGLRVSLSVMLVMTVVSEMIAGNSGIGYLILDAERSFRVPDMYAYVLALALLGYLLNRAFVALDARLLGWHHRMNRCTQR